MTYSEAIKGGWKTKTGLILYVAWVLVGQNFDVGEIYEPVSMLIQLFFGVGIVHKTVKINRIRKND